MIRGLLARVPRPVIRVTQAVAAVVLLVLVWHHADGAQAVRRLAQADPVWLGAAVLALTLQTVLSALRWRLAAGQLGLPLDRRTALREYYLSQVVNQVLPGGMLGDAGRALRTRGAAGLMAAGQAVVFERIAGQIALCAVLLAGLAGTIAVPGGLDWPTWVASVMVGGLAAGLLMAAATKAGWPGPVMRGLPGPAQAALRRQTADFTHAIAAPAVVSRQVALSLGAVLCNVAGFGFSASAVGAALPLPALFALVPLILLAMVIPLTISGWGLREGAAAALFPLAGASASEGLAASIAFGLVFLAATVPGALGFGLWSVGRSMKF